MHRLTCIIVEDEPLAVKVLTNYISQVPFLELKGAFKNAIDATSFLRVNTVELMFLDIHLPGLRGMAFLKSLIQPPAVIITTAYHQYAVEGFDLNVADYLLKPFEFERFLAAVNKVKSTDSRIVTEKEIREFLFLSVQKKKVKIHFNEIAYIESQRDYVKIVTTKNEYISKLSTVEIESLLPKTRFKRVHRSFIISINMIQSYSAESVEVNGALIPIGRMYKDVLENL